MAKKTFNTRLQGPSYDFSTGLRSSDFWEWYEDHEDRVVLDVGFWFINFDITVSDLEPLFKRLFGPRVVDASNDN